MKNLVKMCAVALVMFLGTTTMLTSCNERAMDDFIESVNIVGTWDSSEQISTAFSSQYHYNGRITFRSDHTFFDSNGGEGRWSIRDLILTLDYNRGFQNAVRFNIESGSTFYTVVMNTSLYDGYGNYSPCKVTLRKVR